MSGIVKYGGGFLAVLFGLPLMVGVCAGASRSTSSASSNVAQAEAPSAPAAPAAPAVEVSAVKLWRDYEANEVAADNVYRGRVLAVRGTVAGVRKDFTDDVVLDLASPNEFMSVHANMKDSEASVAAGLSKGTPATVICQNVRQIMGSPALEDCVFAR